MAKLHNVEVEDLPDSFDLHFMGDNLAKTREVGVPLPGKLIGLNVIPGFAARIVAKIFAVPKLGYVGSLSFEEKRMILGCCLCIVQNARRFFRSAQSRQPKAARVRAHSTHHPVVICLVRIAAVFWNSAAMVKLAKILDCVFHGRPRFAEKSSVLAVRE